MPPDHPPTAPRTVIKRDGTAVPYDRERIVVAILKAFASLRQGSREEAERLAEKVEAWLVQAYGSTPPTVEDIQDIVERILMDSGYPEVARAYIIYRHERARLRDARARRVEATDNIPYRIIYEVLLWNLDHRCDTIDHLNEWVESGRFPELVREAEARFDRDLRVAAERIRERQGTVRLVIIAGPSSSGKTTTTMRLSEYLRELGLRLVPINLDHYFFDLENHPRDEYGDYDYETPNALDIERINRDLAALLEGRPIRTPHYDFQTGRRTLDVHPMQLGKDEILLVDSLHGLYGPLTAAVPDHQKFRLYIETLEQVRNGYGVFLRWADLRMMRRMVRDARQRNHAPVQTITHWHYVRTSELKYIIPYINTADYILNSALPHELSILKPRVITFLPEAMKLCRDDPRRQDAYLRAKRLAEWLEPLREVHDDSCIPANSIIREFIGGSVYTY